MAFFTIIIIHLMFIRLCPIIDQSLCDANLTVSLISSSLSVLAGCDMTHHLGDSSQCLDENGRFVLLLLFCVCVCVCARARGVCLVIDCLSVCLSVCLHAYVSLSPLSVCPSIRPSVRLSVCVHVAPSFPLPVWLSS